MKGVQLPLGVQLAESATFESYFPGPNLEAVRALRSDAPLLLLYGPPASGKTHLLQALIHRASETLSCAYLPLRQLATENPLEATGGLESPQLVCIDDADAALHFPGWSEALVRLLDARRAGSLRTVLAASAPPERLSGLRDLLTRFAAAAVFGLKPLNDGERADFLRERARGRGLVLPADAADYLLARLPRDAGSLNAALERLDSALLTAQRPLTLSFVQQWLKSA